MLNILRITCYNVFKIYLNYEKGISKMDFYNYINSKDVAQHLREIKFELNSLQCLWIIFQNEKISLDEKTKILKYILTMPDYEFECFKCPNGISVHKVINDYFDYINAIKVELKSKDENCFYTSYIQYENETIHPGIYFKDYESCYKHIKNNYLDGKRNVLGYRIHKIPFDTYEDTIKATFKDETLTAIHKCGDWDPLINVFGPEFDLIKLPSPFKPGDVLSYSPQERPVVLESVSDEDMSAICYFVSDDGKTIEKDYFLFFTDLEYCTKELIGKDIALYSVSDFIKKSQESLII